MFSDFVSKYVNFATQIIKGQVYLKHILDAIKRIEDYLKIVPDYDRFLKNDMAQDAIIRQLEIIGGASANLSSEFKKTRKNIKWADVKSMRNKLIHEYFGVSLQAVWKTAQEYMPNLKSALQK